MNEDTPFTNQHASKLWMFESSGVTQKWLVDAEYVRKLERVATAFKSVASYAATVRTDRRKNQDGEIMALQTLDWCDGLRERIAEAEKIEFEQAMI